MENVLITGNIDEKLYEEFKLIAERENLRIDFLKTTQEQESRFEDILIEIGKERLMEIVSDFIDLYAVDFKRNNVQIPKYFSISTEQEYNDDTYDTVIYQIYFYDENAKHCSVDMEVEYDRYEYGFSDALKQEIEYGQQYDIDMIKNHLEGTRIIINTGK